MYSFEDVEEVYQLWFSTINGQQIKLAEGTSGYISAEYREKEPHVSLGEMIYILDSSDELISIKDIED